MQRGRVSSSCLSQSASDFGAVPKKISETELRRNVERLSHNLRI